METIRIALDLDDTIFDFLGAYKEAFPGAKNQEKTTGRGEDG